MTVKYHTKGAGQTVVIQGVFSFVKDDRGDSIVDYWDVEGKEAKRKTVILHHKDIITIWVEQ